MRNCFFEENDFSTTVRPCSFIKEDKHGYFTEVRINKTDVVKFMEHGVTPEYDIDNNIFKIAISLNNNTTLHLNGMRASLSDKRLKEIPVDYISIRELALRLYSSKTGYKNRQCYAIKALFRLDLPKKGSANV